MESQVMMYIRKCIPILQDVKIYEELSANRPPSISLLKQCTKYLTSNVPSLKEIDSNIFYITSVIDSTHEELHIGHWKDVKIYKRKLYYFSCYIKILYLLLAFEVHSVKKTSNNILKDGMKLGDLALMLGEPLKIYPNIINDAITFLSNTISGSMSYQYEIQNFRNDIESKILDNTRGIETLSCPSIESFKTLFYDPKRPVKMKDCINHWPALEKWRNLDYILHTAACRTVPVELGSKYTDETWSQKLMTMEEFISEHILNDSSGPVKGYLAQHRLLDQIPELGRDIYVPDYCCISESDSTPEINVWFGPKGTISPLHTDPKNNFLAQVVGVKQIILFSPQDSEFLYAHNETMLNNTSQVDISNPDYEKYPMFKKASPITCTLYSGDILYIPAKWWHYVASETISFSVSFWWE